MSRDLQRLLIKVLEEKTYHRIGDDRPRKSDFRLLTATNLPPKVLRDRLDLDFLDRISPLRLHLPALRDIPEEIPWLWRRVHRTACARSGLRRARTLDDAAHAQITKALQRHPLPGNLRDLFRVAYRVIAGQTDPSHPLAGNDLAGYGLLGLEEEPSASSPVVGLAHAFDGNRRLASHLDRFGRIEIRPFEKAFRAYCAREIMALRSERGAAVKDLCDVAERTLRTWRHPNESAD